MALFNSEDIIKVNGCVHKNRTSKHIKQKLMGLWSSNIVEDLDVPFPVIHRL